MFFYELTLQRALNGIDATAMMPTILNIANAVLLACLLFGIYQAWARGGDSRLLGVTLVKYLAVGLGLYAYSRVFLHSTECSMTLHASLMRVRPGETHSKTGRMKSRPIGRLPEARSCGRS